MSKKTKRIIGIIISLAIVAALCGGAVGIQYIFQFGGERSREIWTGLDEFKLDYCQSIEMRAGAEDFRVLQITDIQMNFSRKTDNAAFDLIEKLVDETKPDLIIMTGDNVAGLINGMNARRLVKFMDSLGVKYAPVLGNHDGEGLWNSEVIGDIFAGGINSLFKKGPGNIRGVGNYVINVTKDGEVVYSLIAMDSNRYRDYPEDMSGYVTYNGSGYDCIYPDQIAWYEWVVKGLNRVCEREVDNLVFMHIPLVQYIDLLSGWDLGKDGPMNGNNLGLFEDGLYRDGIGSGRVDTGMFAKALELGCTRAFVSGHEHTNNFIAVYKGSGIYLEYGTKTGRNSYSDADMQGGTLITIKSGEPYPIFKIIYESSL